MPENCLQQNTVSSQRHISLDIIKLISAFMIVFYHLSEYMNLGFFVNGSYQISFTQIGLSLCSCAVPLFFMVNGALLLNKDYSTEKIYTKAAKVALLIFVWSFLDFPAWFLKTLVVLFLLYPIINKLDKAKKQIWRNLVMLAIFVFPFLYNLVVVCIVFFAPDFSISILGKTLSLETLPLRSGFFTLYSVLYFMIGGILFRYKTKNIVSVIFLVIGWVLVLFDVIASSNYTLSVQDSVNACFPTVGALLISIGSFNLLRNFDNIKSEKLKNIVSKFGEYVLPIYLFHLHIIYKVYINILPSKLNVFIILLLALANYIVCIAAGIVLKKIPLVKELLKM